MSNSLEGLIAKMKKRTKYPFEKKTN